MDEMENFNEASLPEKVEFYRNLNIGDADYGYA